MTDWLKRFPKKWLTKIGRNISIFMIYIGRISMLLSETIKWTFTSPFVKKRHMFNQTSKIGVDSLPIVFLTALFTGVVLALQGAYQMQKMDARAYIANLVSLSMCRELGPVLTALVVAGRVGAAITAELGTMRVTEQIDALETLATNPIKYLIVPRFAAIMIMLPLLTIYADIIGIVGGYIVGVFKLGIGSRMYIKMTFEPLVIKDFLTGVIKSVFFAGLIGIISCYQGFATEGGAEGVGRATTFSVVLSFIMIIAADCIFTALFYFAF
jgi:phospholipid/cholesterol/gamma-HCH transport system permease protein